MLCRKKTLQLKIQVHSILFIREIGHYVVRARVFLSGSPLSSTSRTTFKMVFLKFYPSNLKHVFKIVSVRLHSQNNDHLKYVY